MMEFFWMFAKFFGLSAFAVFLTLEGIDQAYEHSPKFKKWWDGK